MTPRVLFLDFDGVLHPSFGNPGERFCHMPLLEMALSSGPCEIVISSSWRFHHPLVELRTLFPASLRDRVTARTGPPATGERHARHAEILQFLAEFPARDWRALDDSRFEFPDRCPELIHCDGRVGLADAQVAALRGWLNG